MIIHSTVAYADFCQAHAAALPVFFQPWWLDAVGQHGAWQKYVIRDDHGQAIGIWPVFTKRRYGFHWHTLPPYTPISGPWFAEHHHLTPLLLSAFASQIAAGHLYWLLQSMHSVAQATSWRENGFEVDLRHTYRLPPTNDPDELFRRFRTTTRNEIRKADRTLQIRPVDDLRHFLPLYRQHAREKGIFVSALVPVLEAIYAACLERGQGQLLCAYDAQENLHAGVFLVWDQQVTYVLIISRNQNFPTSAATRLLLWRAIQHSVVAGRIFDFNGGDVPSIGNFFAAFGAQKTAYLRATIYPNPLVRFAVKLAKHIRHPRGHLFR